MSKLKMQGIVPKLNFNYVAPSGTFNSDGSGMITTTAPDTDNVALLRQNLLPLTFDGRTTTGSYTPPDESLGFINNR